MHKAYIIIIIGLQTDTSLCFFFYCSNVYKYFTIFLCVNIIIITSMQIDTLDKRSTDFKVVNRIAALICLCYL